MIGVPSAPGPERRCVAILGGMSPATGPSTTDPSELRDRIDDVLRTFLKARRQELEWIDASATPPIVEVIKLFEAGGKRIRPAFCYWGYRAAGGVDGEPIVRAAAALELLHTMALIHDDVIDAAASRRGRATVHRRQAKAAARRGELEPERVGTGVAILAGDLAAVLADQLLLEAGFPPERLAAALEHYHRMRIEMAAGAYLAIVGADMDARGLAFLKGGSYTVEGPLVIGAALAGASVQAIARLERYGEPLGEAFQLLDDLRDGDASASVSGNDARKLIAEAKDALDPDVLDPNAVSALSFLADLFGAAADAEDAR
jgi:geranylgeranyl diphosphate synthase, type I